MTSLKSKLQSIDPNKDLGGARITEDTIGRLHIPHPLQEELIQARVNRRGREFLTFCIKAAHRGNPDAVALLSLIAYCGFLDHGEQRLLRAKGLAEVAHWAGNAFGTFVLGAIHLEERRYRIALELFEQSAKARFAPSSWFAAKMYEVGLASTANKERAAEYYMLGKEVGYLFSDISYFEMIRDGDFGVLERFGAMLSYPYFRIKFKLRNRLQSRTRASHLFPPYAVRTLVDAINEQSELQQQ